MKVKMALGVLLIGLAGCSEHMQFPVSEQAQQQLPSNLHVVRVSTKNIDHVTKVYYKAPSSLVGSPPPEPSRYAYRVGTGDQLRVQVWTTPERSTGSADQVIQPTEGPVVDESGFFFYPFVGEVRARGRTVGDIRQELTERLREYLTNPQVEVAVQEYRAHSAMITGAVGAPGPVVLTNVPMRLIDLLNQSGASEDADLSRVVLRRRGVEYRVNVRAFLEDGHLRQNPLLLPGDAVHVPIWTDNQAFVFGEIRTTEVPLGSGTKSLTELLAEVGGIDRLRANAKGVFVFRRTNVTTHGFDVVFQFDLSDASTLILMKDFPVAAQDIVFVTKDPVTRWTDTVGRVLAPATGLLVADSVINRLSDDN